MAPVNGREKKAFCMKRRRRDRAQTALFLALHTIPRLLCRQSWVASWLPTYLTLYKAEWKAVKNCSLALCNIAYLLCRGCFVVMDLKGAGNNIIKVKVKGETEV